MPFQPPTQPALSATPSTADVGTTISLAISPEPPGATYTWSVFPAIGKITFVDNLTPRATFETTGVAAGPYIIQCALSTGEMVQVGVMVVDPLAREPVPVSLQRTGLIPTPDQALWVIIRNRTNAINFNAYNEFITNVMCSDPHGPGPSLSYTGLEAYRILKVATEAFLLHEAGVVPGITPPTPNSGALDPDEAINSLGLPGAGGAFPFDEFSRLGTDPTAASIQRLRQAYYLHLDGQDELPYLKLIRDKLADIPLKGPGEVTNCYGILKSRLSGPIAIELLWNYWHEEGGLAQSLNAILVRFQNRKLRKGLDPLARFDIDPLRPLGNLLWGWIQDEMNRLTVRRRAFEYDHEYGLRLIGAAVPQIDSVDRRSKFLESFHNLLFLTHVFYKEDDDTTVIADGFPVLNALRETHMLLAEGAHNQFGDLPSTARAEMLIMEWLLARPEMREFIGGRIMVPYEEVWMDRADTMKTMQGWTDVSIQHFRDLGVFGEQLVLSIRYGNWSIINDPQQSANWARYWRPEIQRYAHAYRAATGVDLTERPDATMPAILLQRREAVQRRA